MDRRSFLAGVAGILTAPSLSRLSGALVSAGSDAPPPGLLPSAGRFTILLRDGDHVHSRPCFHRTGQRILVMRAPSGDDPVATASADASPWSLWSVPTTGGAPEIFFEHAEIRATRPDTCWLTGRIAFTGIRSGRGELWTLNQDGTGLSHVPVGDPPRTRVFYPSWFPDGDRIAITDYQARQLLSVSTASGEVTPLTDPGEVQAGMSAVSPRVGEWGTVAFAGQVPGPSYHVSDNSIWLTTEGDPPIPMDEEHGRTPAWSPIGFRLAFSSTRPRRAPVALMHHRSLPGGRSSVFVTSPGRGSIGRPHPFPVSPLDHEALHPKWSADGTEIVMMVKSLADGQSGIAVVEL